MVPDHDCPCLPCLKALFSPSKFFTPNPSPFCHTSDDSATDTYLLPPSPFGHASSWLRISSASPFDRPYPTSLQSSVPSSSPHLPHAWSSSHASSATSHASSSCPIPSGFSFSFPLMMIDFYCFENTNERRNGRCQISCRLLPQSLISLLRQLCVLPPQRMSYMSRCQPHLRLNLPRLPPLEGVHVPLQHLSYVSSS